MAKVDGIVEDVVEVKKNQVKDLTQKAVAQEARNEKMDDRFLMIEKQIQELRKPPPPITFAQVASIPLVGQPNQPVVKGKAVSDIVKKIVNDGKRVVGISSVDQNDHKRS